MRSDRKEIRMAPGDFLAQVRAVMRLRHLMLRGLLFEFRSFSIYRNLGAKAQTVYGWDEAPQCIAMRETIWYTCVVEHMSALIAHADVCLQTATLAHTSSPVCRDTR